MQLPTVLIDIISDYVYDDIDVYFKVEFFERNLDKVDWFHLSQNTNIPVEFFECHLDKVNWAYLSRNHNIPKCEKSLEVKKCLHLIF